MTVDDINVAVTYGASLQRSEVGARTWFAISDAEVQITLQDLGQEEFFLLFSTEVHEGWSNSVDTQHRNRGTSAHRLIKEDELLDRAATLTTKIFGPADSCPTIGAHLLPDATRSFANSVAGAQILDGLFVKEFLVVRAQLGAHRLLFVGVPDIHVSPWESPDSALKFLAEDTPKCRCQLL